MLWVAGMSKFRGSEVGVGQACPSAFPSPLSTHWSRASERKMKSKEEEECQGPGGKSTELTGHYRPLTFTLRAMVSHCRVLSRGVTRAELYLNRSTMATLLRERPQGQRLEAGGPERRF